MMHGQEVKGSNTSLGGDLCSKGQGWFGRNGRGVESESDFSHKFDDFRPDLTKS